MLQLQRTEAVELLSFIQMFQLSAEQLSSKTEDALVEEEFLDASEETANLYLRRYLKTELEMVTNGYLEQSLLKAGFEASIFDVEPCLHPCPCCDFQTLEKRGSYDICRVCFWEDDGTTSSQAEHYSGVNRMTLHEARASYQAVGAVKADFLAELYPDRRSRYRKQSF